MAKVKFIEYEATWENEEGIQKAQFWLLEGDKPESKIGALLNLAELDSDDFGYSVDIKELRYSDLCEI